MVPLIYLQNVDSVGPDATATISSNSHRKPPTALLLTLFKSNPPLFDYEKTDKELVEEFLWQGIYCRMGIKYSLPSQAKLCKYTWKVIACIVITGKQCLDPDI